jgi:hypothetical protein
MWSMAPPFAAVFIAVKWSFANQPALKGTFGITTFVRELSIAALQFLLGLPTIAAGDYCNLTSTAKALMTGLLANVFAASHNIATWFLATPALVIFSLDTSF